MHFVTQELDGGPVIIQAKTTISDDDSADTLAQKIHRLEHRIYPQAVQWFAEDRLQLEPRGAVLDDIVLPPTGHCPE